MRIVFMGTPDFALPSLRRLEADGHTVALVVTQADKPKGRGQIMTPPPVKEYALTRGWPVFQPAKMKAEETLQTIREADPDVIVVVAFGRILPASILTLPRYGCVNVHGSLLPRYRGAAPIQWAVLNGDSEAGVTTMQMNEGLDTGDMLLQSRRPLPEDMTAGELFDLLSEDGAALLSETLKRLEAGTLTPTPQDDALATFAPMLDKSMRVVDWYKPARELRDQIRGLNPWPSATCDYRGKILKLHASRVGGDTNAAPGTVVSVDPLTIACGDRKALILEQVQIEGAKRMAAADFLRGHPLAVGDRLD
ncbi:MAG: methionyl-tRNA formyltransferase [Acutalibacteraceae bacterium]|jgi:methionyl-tRNA formyltransferase